MIEVHLVNGEIVKGEAYIEIGEKAITVTAGERQNTFIVQNILYINEPKEEED